MTGLPSLFQSGERDTHCFPNGAGGSLVMDDRVTGRTEKVKQTFSHFLFDAALAGQQRRLTMNTEMIDRARATVPEGFIFFGYGPVKNTSGRPDEDIINFVGPKWDTQRRYGDSRTLIYAIRAGSKIARLNGLESPSTGKHHADLIQQYCEDWKETDEPWKRWEYRALGSDHWSDLQSHPGWTKHMEYRRKPRTIHINGFEVPEPVREPLQRGQEYFVASIDGEKPEMLPWDDDEIDKRVLKRGLIHLTREAAELHAKALLSFTQQ